MEVLMSETQIEAGAALDALVAIEVIGGYTSAGDGAVSPTDGGFVYDSAFPPAPYSTTYEGAHLVLARLLAMGWNWQATGYVLDPIHAPGIGAFEVVIIGLEEIEASAATFPHAVALAALAAVRSTR
jgi:hypothetical protein